MTRARKAWQCSVVQHHSSLMIFVLIFYHLKLNFTFNKGVESFLKYLLYRPRYASVV